MWEHEIAVLADHGADGAVETLQNHPRLTLVLSHLGGTLPRMAWRLSMLDGFPSSTGGEREPGSDFPFAPDDFISETTRTSRESWPPRPVTTELGCSAERSPKLC